MKKKFIRYDIPKTKVSNHQTGIFYVSSVAELRANIRNALGLNRVPIGTETWEVSEEEYERYLENE